MAENEKDRVAALEAVAEAARAAVQRASHAISMQDGTGCGVCGNAYHRPDCAIGKLDAALDVLALRPRDDGAVREIVAWLRAEDRAACNDCGCFAYAADEIKTRWLASPSTPTVLAGAAIGDHFTASWQLSPELSAAIKREMAQRAGLIDSAPTGALSKEPT